MAEGEEDYDIIPHEEVLKLRKELDEIKKNPLGSTATGRELLESINSLNHNIVNLLNLFKEAAEELKFEENEAKVVSDKMIPMLQKFDTLIDQNEKLAKGIVAVADMVKEESKRPMMPAAPHYEQQMQQRMQPQSFSQQPTQSFSQQPQFANIPPFIEGSSRMSAPTLEPVTLSAPLPRGMDLPPPPPGRPSTLAMPPSRKV